MGNWLLSVYCWQWELTELHPHSICAVYHDIQSVVTEDEPQVAEQIWASSSMNYVFILWYYFLVRCYLGPFPPPPFIPWHNFQMVWFLKMWGILLFMVPIINSPLPPLHEAVYWSCKTLCRSVGVLHAHRVSADCHSQEQHFQSASFRGLKTWDL